MSLHVFPIPIPPPTSLSTQSLWVFPVHQVRALVSCIQPGLVICFTLDNIHVSMLFSRNIPPSPYSGILSLFISIIFHHTCYFQIIPMLRFNRFFFLLSTFYPHTFVCILFFMSILFFPLIKY